MGEEKVDMGKDNAAKRNERNQRTFGNRRDSKVVWHLLMTQKQEDTILQKVEV